MDENHRVLKFEYNLYSLVLGEPENHRRCDIFTTSIILTLLKFWKSKDVVNVVLPTVNSGTMKITDAVSETFSFVLFQ